MNKLNLLYYFFLLGVLFGLPSRPIQADVPQIINYQGKLTDLQDQLVEGVRAVTFTLFTQESGGEAVWAEEHSSVTVDRGLFNVLLGAVNTDTLGAVFNAYDNLYLEMEVGGETLSPRQRLTSVGYAIRATSDNPIGSIQIFAGPTAPEGWFICQGQGVSRAEYSQLFAAIGTIYGAGDGSSTFNLPDLRGMVAVGQNSGESEFDTLGKTGGAKTHTLTLNEMPAHTHIQDAHNHTQKPHNHTQNSHNHTQNSHNHSNTGNNHRGHTHTSAAHSHTASSNTTGAHTHTLYKVWVFAGAGGSGLNDAVGGTGVTAMGSAGNHSHSITVNSATPGATGGASQTHYHAVNNATATNIAATATNNPFTAENNPATAVNQTTGGGAAHNIIQPYVTLHYIIKYI